MKKIMFNDKYGLTQAVLEGRKTMTRRMVNAPEYWHGMWVWGFAFDEQSHSLRLYDADEGPMDDPDTGECAYVKPHYKIGEEVAVAQCYRELYEKREIFFQSKASLELYKSLAGWNNKMFVRADRNVMPHRILITNIKVERLRDISSEDCLKEGIEARVTGCHTFYYIHGEDKAYNFPKQAFSSLIDKVSGKGTWQRNPWVFVYEFELLNS